MKRKLQRSENSIIGRYIAGPQGVDQLVVGIRRRGKHPLSTESKTDLRRRQGASRRELITS